MVVRLTFEREQKRRAACVQSLSGLSCWSALHFSTDCLTGTTGVEAEIEKIRKISKIWLTDPRSILYAGQNRLISMF